MQRNLLFTVMLIIAIPICFSCSSDISFSIKIDENYHNFGLVKIGSSDEYEFKIVNTEDHDITVDLIRFSGSNAEEFVIADGWDDMTIIPGNGGEHTIKVLFVPTLPLGLKEASMSFVWFGSYGSFDITLEGVAVGAPVVSIDSDFHSFGQMVASETKTKDFIVKNVGLADLVVDALRLTGINADEFAITAGSAGGTVLPGESLTVTVEARPNRSGMKDASLEIIHNAEYRNSPLSVELKLECLNDVRNLELVDQRIGETVFLSNANLTFPRATPLYLRNNGNSPVTVTDIAVNVVTGGNFSILSGGTSNGDVIVHAFGGMHEILVEFNPAAVGVSEATLSITSNADNLPSPAVYDMSATGNSGTVGVYYRVSNTPTARRFRGNYSTGTPVFNAATASYQDETSLVNLPFSFDFFGQTYNEFYVCVDGFVAFENPSPPTGDNKDITDMAAPNKIIAPMWDEWQVRGGTNDRVYTQIIGSAPNRQLVIEWWSMSGSGANTTSYAYFGISLHETTSIIELYYYYAVGLNTSATSGIKWTGADSYAADPNSPNMNTWPTRDYMYTPSSLPYINAQDFSFIMNREAHKRVFAVGGTRPYTFEFTNWAPAQPAGLEVNSDGTFTGTPTEGGNFSADVTVTDANGKTYTRNVGITIDATYYTEQMPISMVPLPSTANEVIDYDEDDENIKLDIGFDFEFFGKTYNELYACTNGFISFGSGNSSVSNRQIPSSYSPNN